MKITKAQGRACLRELQTGISTQGSMRATKEAMDRFAFDSEAELATALALCAAIAGVKPEDVE